MKTFIHRSSLTFVYGALLIILLSSCSDIPSDGRYVIDNVESRKKGVYRYLLFSVTGHWVYGRDIIYLETDTLYQHGDTLVLKLKNNESKIN